MDITLFGSNNPTGAAFLNISSNDSVEIWGRNPTKDLERLHVYCDLTDMYTNSSNQINGIVVSFAPIWLLAPFLLNLLNDHPTALRNLKGIIACSSSSFITKRFAFNLNDKELVSTLEYSHRLIIRICERLVIPFQILAPTMVYGKVMNYSDKNLSRIVSLMRFSPFIFLPKSNGLRQPIHATQLARVAYKQAHRIWTNTTGSNEVQILALGGDSTLSYKHMLEKIQQDLGQSDSAKRCLILAIPDKLFFLLIALLLPINPKLFEAVMRINSDLSNFAMAHEILGDNPLEFPVHPLTTKP
jgi:hypothetical protein